MITKRAEQDLATDRVLLGSGGGPMVLRILLGGQLRRLRLAKGISREDAGYAIRASHAKISRMELGQVSFKPRDVADLLQLYGVTDRAERDALLALADSANAQGWWRQYGHILPNWFEVYVGLEEAATIIRTFEVQFVPGLLQTKDYARAVIRLGHSGASADEIESRVEMRMRRQQRVIGPDAPRLWAVIDEAALRRPYGSREVMDGQLAHLLRMSAWPNITVQIVPFAHGGHPAAGGPFSILRFEGPQLADVVYLEQLSSALYLDKDEDIHCYTEVMDRLCVQALPPGDTPAFLHALRDEVR